MNWPLPILILLTPLSWVYGAFVRFKTWLYVSGKLRAKRLNGAVISVGNLTVGGAGKTPLVIWLAKKLMEKGKRVAILSRGYRGENGTSDEVEVMKRRISSGVRFGVGPDRFAEGRKLELEAPVDIFVLDDGFQHLQLARDVDILLLDCIQPSSSNLVLPAGRLREPISGANRADIFVIARDSGVPQPRDGQDDLFLSNVRVQTVRELGNLAGTVPLADLCLAPTFAFCGVAKPIRFFQFLKENGIDVRGRKSYRDHHPYSQADIDALENSAAAAGAALLITTEKDEANLGNLRFNRLPVFVLAIDLEIEREELFLREIDRLIIENRDAR